jgi:hypothetical protein
VIVKVVAENEVTVPLSGAMPVADIISKSGRASQTEPEFFTAVNVSPTAPVTVTEVDGGEVAQFWQLLSIVRAAGAAAAARALCAPMVTPDNSSAAMATHETTRRM